MAYDALGQASAYRDPTGITTQTYAARGMLATVATPSHPHGAALTYGFDANGQRTRMALGIQRHTFDYDALGAMTEYVNPESGRATWSYDFLGEATEQVNPNGAATTWTYDARGMLETMVAPSHPHGAALTWLPYCWGRALQGAPVRSTQKMALNVRRSSVRGRRVLFLGGKSGWMSSHWASVRSVDVASSRGKESAESSEPGSRF